MKFRTKVLITAVLTVAISVNISTSFPTKGKTKSVESTDVHITSSQCLAKNIYYEARNQGTAGWLAVTAVVINRVNDKRFPNTICDVIKQGPSRPSWQNKNIRIPIKHRCQFSWYCDGKSDNPKDKQSYKLMLNFIEMLFSDELPFIDITDGAQFYHADYVRPAWAKTKKRTIEIEDHIFYKWK